MTQTMKNANRALETITADATKLVQVRLLSAVEAGDWVAVHHLSEQLQEIAARGRHHAAMARMGEVNKVAMASHAGEREAR
jgi:hypothetical protein